MLDAAGKAATFCEARSQSELDSDEMLALALVWLVRWCYGLADGLAQTEVLGAAQSTRLGSEIDARCLYFGYKMRYALITYKWSSL